MKDTSVFPLSLKIHDLEKSLVSDYMIGRFHENKKIRECCAQILELLKIARGYLVIGRERKSARTYLRALNLKKIMVFRFRLDPEQI